MLCDLEGNVLMGGMVTHIGGPSGISQAEKSLNLKGPMGSRSGSTDTVRADAAVVYSPSVLEMAEANLSFEERDNDER